ncbi:tropomyosin-like [Physella acuta]|uniref:tropomyosin-like n=1 Tax=Physella acuta TaxID=109671 RepID=UPI0027DBEE5A|nr:tropomyosin-like [Physella acuta]
MRPKSQIVAVSSLMFCLEEQESLLVPLLQFIKNALDEGRSWLEEKNKEDSNFCDICQLLDNASTTVLTKCSEIINRDADREVLSLTESPDNLSSEPRLSRDKSSEILARLENLETLKQDVGKLAGQQDNFQQTLEKFEKSLSSLKKTNKRMSSKLTRVEEKLNKCEEKEQEAEEYQNTMEEKLNKLEKNQNDIEEQQSDMEEKFKDVICSQKEIDKKATVLEQSLIESEKKVENCCQEINAQKSKHEDDTSKIEDFRRELTEINTDIQTQVKSLSNRVQLLEDALRDLSDQQTRQDVAGAVERLTRSVDERFAKSRESLDSLSRRISDNEFRQTLKSSSLDDKVSDLGKNKAIRDFTYKSKSLGVYPGFGHGTPSKNKENND